MTKGLVRSLSRGNPLLQPIIKQKLIVDTTITISSTGAAIGFGTVLIGDFPEGNILLLGTVGYLDFAGSGVDANLIDTWSGDFAIGSAPTADNALAGAEVDILSSTAIGPATAEVIGRTRSALSGDSILDNTDGSLELNLNMLIDAADITDDQSVIITVTGEINIAYVMLGDD